MILWVCRSPPRLRMGGLPSLPSPDTAFEYPPRATGSGIPRDSQGNPLDSDDEDIAAVDNGSVHLPPSSALTATVPDMDTDDGAGDDDEWEAFLLAQLSEDIP